MIIVIQPIHDFILSSCSFAESVKRTDAKIKEALQYYTFIELGESEDRLKNK